MALKSHEYNDKVVTFFPATKYGQADPVHGNIYRVHGNPRKGALEHPQIIFQTIGIRVTDRVGNISIYSRVWYVFD